MHTENLGVFLVILLVLALVLSNSVTVAAQQENCVTVDIDITSTAYPLITNWPPEQTGEICLLVTFTSLNESKLFSFEGWVFGEPIVLNDSKLETYQAPGELAEQLIRKEVVVDNTTTLKFVLTKLPGGNELGLWWSLQDIPHAPAHMVYIPLVAKAAPTLLVTEQFSPGRDLYVKSWPEAEADQMACMSVLSNTPFTARVERIWFFGDQLQVQVNGNSLNIAAKSIPGELALQTDPFNVQNATNLTVCTNGPNPGREIGVIIRP